MFLEIVPRYLECESKVARSIFQKKPKVLPNCFFKMKIKKSYHFERVSFSTRSPPDHQRPPQVSHSRAPIEIMLLIP